MTSLNYSRKRPPPLSEKQTENRELATGNCLFFQPGCAFFVNQKRQVQGGQAGRAFYDFSLGCPIFA
jgi:hypothetical protein